MKIKVRHCARCGGTGFILKMVGNTPEFFDFKEECPDCNGTGHIIEITKEVDDHGDYQMK